MPERYENSLTRNLTDPKSIFKPTGKFRTERSGSMPVGPLIRIVVVVFLGLIGGESLALDQDRQIYQYIHEKWSLEDGLPQSSVLGFAQTDDGYIWLATAEGLARFDGVHFQVFDTSNTPAMKNNFIMALIKDSREKLWLGMFGGGVTVFFDGKFRTYGKEHGLSSEYIWDIMEDSSGEIWVATREAGVFRFADERFHSVESESSNKDHLAAYDLIEDSNKKIWVATNGGVYRFSKRDPQKREFVEGLSSSKGRVVFEDSKKRIWIGTHGGGLHQYRDGKAHPVKMNLSTEPQRIMSFFEDANNNLWIGTAGDGLMRFVDGTYTQFSSEEGLSDDTVSAFFEDRESNLWVGTHGGGVNLFRDGKFTTYNKLSGLSYDIVFSMCADTRGDWWVGTYGGGLNRTSNGAFTRQSLKPDNEPLRIESVICARSGDVWVGTYGSGLFRIRNGQTTPFLNQEKLEKTYVASLFEDREGRIWAGTSHSGLYMVTQQDIINYTTEQGLPSNMVRPIAQDEQGVIWIGTNQGVSRFQDGKFKSYTEDDGLPSNLVFSLLPDRDGSLWIGTYGGGLSRLKDEKIQTVTRADGLHDDVVYTIVEDSQKNFWMTSNKGISYTSKNDILSFFAGKLKSVMHTSFGVEDGIKSKECNGGFHPASFQLSDGNLLFPTIAGIARVNPNNIPINTHLPPVTIERILIDGKVARVSDLIEIQPENRRVEFQYTAPSFVAPRSISFKFMLEGFDADWIDVGSRRSAFYTNLAPGDYRFRVIAANNDGLWNEVGKTIAVKKLPFFYETTWFAIVVAAALLLLVYGLVRLRLHRIKKRNIELEGLVAERTQKLKEAHGKIVKLEKETTERQMAGGFAHEIRNALAGANMMMKKILHFSDEGQSIGALNSGYLVELFRTLKTKLDKPSLQDLVPIVHKMNELEKKSEELVTKAQVSVDRSLGVTKQILQYSEVGSLQPGCDDVDIADLVQEIQTELEETFSEHDIECTANIDDGITFHGDRQHYYTILSNLVLNAKDALIDHTEKPDTPKRIIIDINSDEDRCLIAIEDSGTGISEEELMHIFDPFFTTNPESGTGLGVGLVQKYVTMYGGDVHYESLPGQGTTVTVTLPLKKE